MSDSGLQFCLQDELQNKLNSWHDRKQLFSLSVLGSITSLAVHRLSSSTRYFFKCGASTDVGPGPYSPTKDVQTPLPNYGMCHEILTINGESDFL